MDYKFEICTIIITYNSDIKELKRTIFSVLMQKNISSQIIICDDGSLDFNEKEIDSFFKKYNFSDYKIILNKQNHGIVHNISTAIPYIDSHLVKTISPKDYLYNETVYEEVLNIYKNKSFDLLIGKGLYYSNNNDLKFYNISTPRKKIKTSDFLKNKTISKRLIKYRDWFLGAAFIINSTCFKYYIDVLKNNKIKYCEDLSSVLLSLDSKKIFYLNKYMLWYEYGTGISTNSSSSFSQMLQNDYDEFFENYLPKMYNSKIVKKGRKINQLLKLPKQKRHLKLALFFPSYYLYRVLHSNKSKLKQNEKKIEKIINEVNY